MEKFSKVIKTNAFKSNIKARYISNLTDGIFQMNDF